jgi:hypothetical protein
MIDTNTLYGEVAREAWQSVNDAAKEYESANPDDAESVGGEGPYLYVFADGSWTIDYPDYIPTTNNCISNIPVSVFNGPAELADEIESNEDWDAIEDANGEDEE